MQPTQQRTRTQPATAHQPPTTRRRWRRFARHYLEMVAAMVAGMLVGGGALRGVLAVAGVPYSLGRYPGLVTLEMGVTMALGMGAWMRYRRHRWPATLEMSGAMLVPAVAAVALVVAGVLDGGTAMTAEHVAMLPLMLAVMLRRRDEYLSHH
jgi:hypothetical protein